MRVIQFERIFGAMYINKKEAVIKEALIVDENIALNQKNYKEIWHKINEITFVMEIDEEFVPKCFVDCNSKVFSHLGYSKEEFIKIQPSNILNFDKNETDVNIYRNLIYKKCDKVGMILK